MSSFVKLEKSSKNTKIITIQTTNYLTNIPFLNTQLNVGIGSFEPITAIVNVWCAQGGVCCIDGALWWCNGGCGTVA
jgi:hypothetical protein